MTYTEAADAELVAELAPTGTLRAVINLGNPVLSHGTPTTRRRDGRDRQELPRRLGVPVALSASTRPGSRPPRSRRARPTSPSWPSSRRARTRSTFSPPYVVIEGVYVVRRTRRSRADDVDRPGTTIGVKEGSAYDLYLTRTVEHAEIVRGTEAPTSSSSRAWTSRPASASP